MLSWIDRGQEKLDPARRYWVLDPIDGTKGFLRKGQYAIALALIERGEIILGLLACPNLPASLASDIAGEISPGAGQIQFAIRGQGAFAVDIPAEGAPGVPVPLRVAAELWNETSNYFQHLRRANNLNLDRMIAQ